MGSLTSSATSPDKVSDSLPATVHNSLDLASLRKLSGIDILSRHF
jgi:hypothetical protein